MKNTEKRKINTREVYVKQVAKAKCIRDFTAYGMAGCGYIEFYRGEIYEFDVEEKVECNGLVKYKEYTISLPQKGIIWNPELTVSLFTRHFYGCRFFDDYFLLIR